MNLIQDPLDCSTSLTPLLPNPFNYPNFPYNSNGPSVTIVPTFESVFAYTQQADCVITECRMRDPDCLSTVGVSGQTDVAIGTATDYKLTASGLVPAGYALNICYQCEV